ncbi:MAG: alpha/beta hydrolase [Lachnospiraceae bacterium]|nr:alpha/beta hydrolase [Ruminococcus sp.]MCM1275681.1 alpha/beta hydrolase [Lachnospiraceae bacterium]
MKFFEFGKEHKKLMVMLHGGGVSYLGAEPVAEYMAKKFHVVLVAYDGFNPSEPETEFVSAMHEANQIAEYILENYGGKIDVLYGVSYGCRVLLEVLRDERLTITTTIADGFPTRDYPDIKSELGKELYCFFFTGIFYVIMGRAGKQRKKFLAKITGRTYEEAERLVYTKATWKSWKNQDYYLIGRKTDYETFKRTDMYVWYGINSSAERKIAKNIQKLQDAGYAFTLKIFKDVGHGGLAGEQTDRFLKEVMKAHLKSLEKQEDSKNEI